MIKHYAGNQEADGKSTLSGMTKETKLLHDWS